MTHDLDQLLKSLPIKAGLNVRTVRSQKVFPIRMKFGMQVDVDEWCTVVCIPYNHVPIRGQDQGHVTLNVENSYIFKIYLLRHLKQIWWQILN